MRQRCWKHTPDPCCRRRRLSLPLTVILAAPPALRGRVVRMWLRAQRGDLRRVTAAHIRAVVDLALGERPGARVRLPGGERVVREYEQLRWKADETPAAAEPQREIVPGSSISLATGWSITAELLDEHRLDLPPTRTLWEMAADAATVPAPLIVRGARPGDRVRPLGLRGQPQAAGHLRRPQVAARRTLVIPRGGGGRGGPLGAGNRSQQRRFDHLGNVLDPASGCAESGHCW